MNLKSDLTHIYKQGHRHGLVMGIIIGIAFSIVIYSIILLTLF